MTEHDGNGMEEGMEIVPGLSWDEVHVLHYQPHWCYALHL